MPTTVTYFSPKQGREDFTYDLTASVGMGGKNLPSDLRLVQTLLNIVYYIHPDPNRPPPPGEQELAVDGKFGPHTHAHIRQFKALMREHGYATPPDGQIDPFRGHPYKRTRTGGPYVQNMLNNAAHAACAKAGRVGDYRLHGGPRPVGAFPVDPDLQKALQSSHRMELDGYPSGPLPL